MPKKQFIIRYHLPRMPKSIRGEEIVEATGVKQVRQLVAGRRYFPYITSIRVWK